MLETQGEQGGKRRRGESGRCGKTNPPPPGRPRVLTPGVRRVRSRALESDRALNAPPGVRGRVSCACPLIGGGWRRGRSPLPRNDDVRTPLCGRRDGGRPTHKRVCVRVAERTRAASHTLLPLRSRSRSRPPSPLLRREYEPAWRESRFINSK